MFDYRYLFDGRMLVPVFNLSLLHPVTDLNERQETDTGIKKTEEKRKDSSILKAYFTILRLEKELISDLRVWSLCCEKSFEGTDFLNAEKLFSIFFLIVWAASFSNAFSGHNYF